ncbi:MAG TPA: PKD domain-containing protein, partial [Phaeodactylibacter sp.]|nr:PKD domain-containing protein [Phaeodactylibacter sp.]
EVVGPQAVATFVSSEMNGCAPLTVTYTDLSTGNPTAWNWTFPGGTPSTSTDQNPTIIYNTGGTYDVTLEVTNFAGTNSIMQPNYLTIQESPVADFTASIDLDGNVTFTNNSILGNTYEWNFGDGNTTEEVSPVYTYEVSGVYTVLLITTNECGSDTTSQEIDVQITGIDEIHFLEKFELYPNPNNGEFVLHLEGEPTDELELDLFNVLGQVVFSKKIDFHSGKTTQTFYLKKLPAASYILQIKSEGRLMYRKVVKH